MIAFWKTLLAFLFLPLYIGGSSRSSTATTTNYSTVDDRIAAGEGALVLRDSEVAGGQLLKVAGNNNNITSADPQVVKEAFAYARSRDALAGESLEKILGKSGEIVAAQAGKFSERTIIILAAAAGVVLLMVMRKGKA